MQNAQRSWSFSSLSVWETCPKWYALQYIQKKPIVPRSDESAANRGTQIHAEAEQYLSGLSASLPASLRKYEYQFARAREFAQAGLAFLELRWGLDMGWNAAPWDTAWLRLIIDLYVALDSESAILVDFKTGKRFGNELKHAKQLLLYSLAAFSLSPTLEEVTCQVWYLDHGPSQFFETSYTRAQAMKFFNLFNPKALEMTTAPEQQFLPKPSAQRCLFCPYAARKNKWVFGTGDCTLNPPNKHDETTYEPPAPTIA